MTTIDNSHICQIESPLSELIVENPLIERIYWNDAPNPGAVVIKRMACILAFVIALISVGAVVAHANDITDGDQPVAEVDPAPAAGGELTTPAIEEVSIAAISAGGGIAPLFTKEVQHWAPQIVAWANAYGLDPNMAATVMQIESCGDPNAVSGAGAQGLFQVMPFHFEAGESMQDPDTNARRGMAYLALGMEQTGGDVNRTFAGYNGGHGTAARSWDTWPAETQRYYVWSTGIYQDAAAGSASSERLEQWLNAGGASLCRQAAARLGLAP